MGTGLVNLTMTPQDDEITPDWSPDGRRIAFSTIILPHGPANIEVMNVDGSGQIHLTDNLAAVDLAPTWSPDGTRVAFQSDRRGNWDIYAMAVPDRADVDGSDVIQLTNDPADNVDPDWSPTGQHLAFSSGYTGNMKIYVMKSDGSGQIRLTLGLYDTQPAWSPDGTQIAFTAFRNGNVDIYVMQADGSEQTRLTDSPAQDICAVWQPAAR